MTPELLSIVYFFPFCLKMLVITLGVLNLYREVLAFPASVKKVIEFSLDWNVSAVIEVTCPQRFIIDLRFREDIIKKIWYENVLILYRCCTNIS